MVKPPANLALLDSIATPRSCTLARTCPIQLVAPLATTAPRELATPRNSLAPPERTSTELVFPWHPNATLASEDGTALDSETASPLDAAAPDTSANEELTSQTLLTVGLATYAPRVTIVRSAPRHHLAAHQEPTARRQALSVPPSALIAAQATTAKVLEMQTSLDLAQLGTTARSANQFQRLASTFAHTDNAALLPLRPGLAAHLVPTSTALVVRIATPAKPDTTATKPCLATTAVDTHSQIASRTTLASVPAPSDRIAPLVLADPYLAQLERAATSSLLRV